MIQDIKTLRAETGLSIKDIRKALEKANGDVDLARMDLLKNARAKDAAFGAGRVQTYTHHNGLVGSVVAVACATDFAANTEDMQMFCTNLAQHVAFYGEEDLMQQPWMLDDKFTVGEIVTQFSQKLGEPLNIVEARKVEIKPDVCAVVKLD